MVANVGVIKIQQMQLTVSMRLFANLNQAINTELIILKAIQMENRKMKLRSENSGVIKAMTEPELNASTKAIKGACKDIQREVTIIELCKGWEVKGYSSFKEYCNVEFIGWEIAYDALNRHRRIGLIIVNVAGIDAVGKHKGNAIMEMVKLEPKQQKHIWKKLQKKCGQADIPRKWLTKKRVEEMAIKLGYRKPSPSAEITSGGKNNVKGNSSTVDIDDVEIDANPDADVQDIDTDQDDKSEEMSAAVGKKKACIDKFNSDGVESDQDPHKPEISQVEAEFFSCFESEFLHDEFFSRRIKNCIENSFSENCIVTLCKHLLVELEHKQQKRVFTYLKQNS